MSSRKAEIEARWKRWTHDPVAEKHGITFDRTEAGPIHAPPGKVRVCAYHVDWDERPVCYMDVDSLDEARFVCSGLAGHSGGWNVDYAAAYDEQGRCIVPPPF